LNHSGKIPDKAHTDYPLHEVPINSTAPTGALPRPNHDIIENNHMGSFKKHPLPAGYTSKDLDDIIFNPRVDDYYDHPNATKPNDPRSPLPGGLTVASASVSY
jgi:hypothetical protein